VLVLSGVVVIPCLQARGFRFVSDIEDPAAAVLAAPAAIPTEEPEIETFQSEHEVLPAHRHHPPHMGETLTLEGNVGQSEDLTKNLAQLPVRPAEEGNGAFAAAPVAVKVVTVDPAAQTRSAIHQGRNAEHEAEKDKHASAQQGEA
jgi:hypothetical protein